jgi:peptidoglycan/LPS O-acetylase OafA/YrhL
MEMPILFFITGAGVSLSKQESPIAFYVHRLSRILIPFWIYGAVYLALEFTIGSGIRSVNETILIGWLVPLKEPPSTLAPLNWHLWFVPIYLAVTLLLPALRSLHYRLPERARYVPLIAWPVVIWQMQRLTGFDQTRMVVFYSFWAYLGLFYTQLKERPWPRGAVLACSLIAYASLTGLILAGWYLSDFQWNKFPPNLAFLLLGIGHVGMLSLARRPILAVARKAPMRWALSAYSRYGYTIYLYHMLILWGWLQLFTRSPRLQQIVAQHPVVSLVLMIVVVVPLAALLAWPFQRVERFRVRMPNSLPPTTPSPHVRQSEAGTTLASLGASQE